MPATVHSTDHFFESLWGIASPGAFFVLVSYLLSLFIFGPLHAEATSNRPPMRFRLADIIVLLAQLQIAAGVLFAAARLWGASGAGIRIVAAIAIWSLLTFWWWTGVRMLSKARIERGTDRILFLSVAAPLGYVTALSILLTPILAVLALGTLYWSVLSASFREAVILIALILSTLAIYACAFCIRWYCGRLVERAHDDLARRDGIDFGATKIRAGANVGGFPSPATERQR